ncbi:MAG: TraB/GumN family protein [Acidobacteriota bacterium]
MTEDQATEEPSQDVHRLASDGRQIILIGTAHISQESADLVHQVIEDERPDRVCVELDERRFESLSQETRWENLDIKEVIRNKQLSTLLVNLLLGAYQKKLGGQIGVTPGSELLAAAKTAQALGIPVALCDRDIRITLRRAWRRVGFFKKLWLMASIVTGLLDDMEISEEQLREIRQKDVLNEMMAELGQAMPALKEVLIDERDVYLAEKIRDTPGDKLVAVVGAGHVAGMVEVLQATAEADLEELEVIPPISPIWKWIGWGIPAMIVGAIVYIGFQQGGAAAGDNIVYWILANGIPSAIGAALALAHPLAIASAFLSAPLTSLTPVIGAGYVVAFVQAYFRPPKVKEFQSVGDDFMRPKRWWGNKLLRILLVFILTGLGSMLGSVVGGWEILTNLFQ